MLVKTFFRCLELTNRQKVYISREDARIAKATTK